MRRLGLGLVLFGGLVLIAFPFRAFGGHYQVVNGPKEFYFAHVSLVDLKGDGKDPIVFRAETAEPVPATLNLPLGPGDTIRTSDVRRCEIEFDNGTIIRLDTDTELRIETILARALSSSERLSNLVLGRGRIYAMYKQYGSGEVFQVMTPGAAVKFTHNTVATIGWETRGGTDVQVKYGKASVLYGADPENLVSGSVHKNERLKVLPDQKPLAAEYDGATEFETWNTRINDEFVELHKGKSVLPKPVQRLPEAVFYFAQRYGDLYGEWIYDDLYGYVWRPYSNDHYPGGTWQPFSYGRWDAYAGQMYWVPEEPWGWIPYHLGVWQWDASKGWLWLPGSAFAPAWVDWAFMTGGFYSWRPWSLWDWMWFDDFSFFSGFYDPYFSWRYGNSAGVAGLGGGTVAVNPSSSPRESLDRVSKDQLQKPGKGPFPIPNELKGVYKSAFQAVKGGNERAVSSLREASKHTLIVKAADLNSPAIRDRTVRLDSAAGAAIRSLPSGGIRASLMSEAAGSWASSSTSARRTFDLNARNAESGARSENGGGARVERLTPVRELPGAVRSALPFSTTRIHDWNSDTRIGRQMGVDIVYRSQTNEVYCPQLSISSNMIHARPLLGRASESGSSGRSSGGSYSAGGSSSSGGSSSGGSSSSGSSSGSSGGGGGHIRN